MGMWGGGATKNDSESEEESSEEESSEDEAGPSGSSKAPKAELTREELKAQKKARKEAAIARAKAAAVQVGDLPPSDSEEESGDDDAPMPANPNHSKAARKQTQKAAPAPKAADNSDDETLAKGVKKVSIADSAPGNRKEREAAAAAAAKERYQKLHEAGKTDQAKADLARLKLIREKREQEAARKQVCGTIYWCSRYVTEHNTDDARFDRPRRRSAKPRRSSRGNSLRPRRLRGARPPLVPRRRRAARNKRLGGGCLDSSFVVGSFSILYRPQRICSGNYLGSSGFFYYSSLVYAL